MSAAPAAGECGVEDQVGRAGAEPFHPWDEPHRARDRRRSIEVNSPEIVVKSRHVDLPGPFREHVDEKLSRVARFGIPLRRIDVQVAKESNPRLADRAFKVELTCRGKGPVIRAEASAADKFAALDRAYSRLEERLRRQADRHRFHRHGRSTERASDGAVAPPASGAVSPDGDAADAAEAGADSSAVYESGPVIVREKSHDAVPMSVEQALSEMELVGHDFFLFVEVSSSCPAVVYRRRGYDYGLIRIDAGRSDG